MQTKNITYRATGTVYGKYWGGGEGSYPAESYHADTIDKLKADIINDVNTGAIDSGMGYEKVLGAMMVIETITYILIDGKVFLNVTTDVEFFGDLTDEQKEWLESYA